MSDLLSTVITQADLPKEVPKDTPTPAQPVTAGQLVTDQTGPSQPPATPAQPVTAGELVGEITPTPANEKPSQQAFAAIEDKLGCQCERCKANPAKRDKRGRHHRICPCDSCKKSRGETVEPVPDFSDMTPEQAATDYVAMSGMLFDSTTGLLTMTFGPEWQPQSPQEREAVTKCLETYLRSKEVKDIPPGLMLTLVVVAYSAQRLKAPTTANKLQLAWTWLKSKLTRKRNPVLTVIANNQQQENKI